MALGAVRDEFDVAVLMSADTDLVPAVEAVLQAGKRCEVAGWQPPGGYATALRVRGIWTHRLARHEFDLVADQTDYTVGYHQHVAKERNA
jgi:uncharacterized LabA/DUF88 family protein